MKYKKKCQINLFGNKKAVWGQLLPYSLLATCLFKIILFIQLCRLLVIAFLGIQEIGAKAHLGLKKLYSVCAQSEAADTCVSGMMDFWSGRHLFRVGYGGILACGHDKWS